LAIALARLSDTPQAHWAILQSGAADVLEWQPPKTFTEAVVARLVRWAEIDELAASDVVQNMLVGRSPEWLALVRQLIEAARYSQSPLLITGESGTGKEVAARAVHALDSRTRNTRLTVVDCSTLVPSLSGSEFFGHERGAFTGAVNARDGAFALADGGTLFLDEVGELPLEMQPQLLRAIQEHTYKPVGGNIWKTANFRLICATNRNLTDEVAAGRFRADLYYRLAGLVCRLPPLRERMTDIPLLAEHFLAELSPSVRSIDPPVLSWLIQREYKNNVRELRLLVARMLHRHAGPGSLSAGDIPPEERPDSEPDAQAWQGGAFAAAVGRAVTAGAGLKEIGRAAEDLAMDFAIQLEGSIAGAATRLGVTDRALQLRRAVRRERAHRANCAGAA
jgi:transcriptional regulator with GAF, ATPase, and Fis domain